jgi:glycine cleavage system H protein
MTFIAFILALALMVAYGSRRRRESDAPDLSAEFIAEKRRLFQEAETTWQDRFDALSPDKKTCRFSLLGAAMPRQCDNAFGCSTCELGRTLMPHDLTARRPSLEDQEVAGVRIAGHVFLHRGHTWASLEPDGRIRVGLDDLARRTLGFGVRLNAPVPGALVEQGETLALAERGGTAVSVLAPVDGRVACINHDVLEDPTLIQRDPYGRGWIAEIKPYNLYHNLRSLLNGVEARLWMAHEVDQLQHRLLTAGEMARAADGGHLVDDLAPVLGDHWAAVNRDLLLAR